MADNCDSCQLLPNMSRELMVPKGLNSFVEPCYAMYDIKSPGLDHAAAELKKTIAIREDAQVIVRCRQKRIERIELMNTAIRELVCGE